MDFPIAAAIRVQLSRKKGWRMPPNTIEPSTILLIENVLREVADKMAADSQQFSIPNPTPPPRCPPLPN